jgi:hypothetical protein
MSPHKSAAGSTPETGATAPGTHPESEHYAWTIQIPDHHKRTESSEYRHARKLMRQLVDSVEGFAYGEEPVQDHHGGGLWLKDADGWFLVRNLMGIEWSAQFCADPAKVDLLRRNARRLYAAFPDAVKDLGIRELLDTPITDADGIQRWTDSICNASVPLPKARHVGVLPNAHTGGVHHYPSPITEIELFKRDDFDLWVVEEDKVTALVPLSPRGSGDARARVLLAATRPPADEPTPLAALAAEMPHELGATAADVERTAREVVDDAILPASHPLAQKAFARQ